VRARLAGSRHYILKRSLFTATLRYSDEESGESNERLLTLHLQRCVYTGDSARSCGCVRLFCGACIATLAFVAGMGLAGRQTTAINLPCTRRRPAVSACGVCADGFARQATLAGTDGSLSIWAAWTG